MQIDERLAGGCFVVDQHQRTGVQHHFPHIGIDGQVDQVRTGVTVLFFESSEQFGTRRVTRTDHVDDIGAAGAEGTMNTGAEADCRLGHANHEHRAWQVGRNFRRQVFKACVHHRRPHGDVTSQDFGHKQERTLRVTALGKSEQCVGGDDTFFDVDVESPAHQLRAKHFCRGVTFHEHIPRLAEVDNLTPLPWASNQNGVTDCWLRSATADTGTATVRAFTRTPDRQTVAGSFSPSRRAAKIPGRFVPVARV
ncbi:hypothetical protein D3C86_1404110 [compost metagenome]